MCLQVLRFALNVLSNTSLYSLTPDMTTLTTSKVTEDYHNIT